jgi:hypothetical protein
MKRIKNWCIRAFGLQGSWSWAKKEMKNGAIIKSRSWTGSLKYRIDSPKNGLLLMTFDALDLHPKWEIANWFMTSDENADYFVTAKIGISYPDSLKWEVIYDHRG